jgi:monoamine oxidase
MAVDKFRLPTAPFTMNNPAGWCHLFGRKHRFRDVEANPQLVGAHLADGERSVACGQLWERAIRPFADAIAAQGEAGWDDIVRRYDDHSTREFLRRWAGRRRRSSSSASR